MRTFISINPGENTKYEVLKIQDELKNRISALNEKYHEHIKWESMNKFHITLFFIGETNESLLSNIDLKLTNAESHLFQEGLSFTSGAVNAFPKLRYPRVLILELINDDKKVFTLQQKIYRILNSEGINSDKKFHPHITLGRIKRDHKINLSELKISMDHNLSFSVSEFCLMESKLKSSGSEYSLIKKYNL